MNTMTNEIYAEKGFTCNNITAMNPYIYGLGAMIIFITAMNNLYFRLCVHGIMLLTANAQIPLSCR